MLETSGEQCQKLAQPREITGPSWRKLIKHRPQVWAKASCAFQQVLQGFRNVFQFAVVRNKATGLYRVEETRWCYLTPAVEGLGKRKMIEGVIDLDGIEMLHVVAEPLPRWEVLGVEDATPIFIHPPGRTDPYCAKSTHDSLPGVSMAAMNINVIRVHNGYVTINTPPTTAPLYGAPLCPSLLKGL